MPQSDPKLAAHQPVDFVATDDPTKGPTRLRKGSMGGTCGGALSVLLVSLAGFVFAPRISHCVFDCRVKARADLLAINEALYLYRHEHGALPTTEAGLRALVNHTDPDAGNLPLVPVDPWGNDYVYQLVGSGFRVASYGADGAVGGAGANADMELRDAKLAE